MDRAERLGRLSANCSASGVRSPSLDRPQSSPIQLPFTKTSSYPSLIHPGTRVPTPPLPPLGNSRLLSQEEGSREKRRERNKERLDGLRMETDLRSLEETIVGSLIYKSGPLKVHVEQVRGGTLTGVRVWFFGIELQQAIGFKGFLFAVLCACWAEIKANPIKTTLAVAGIILVFRLPANLPKGCTIECPK